MTQASIGTLNPNLVSGVDLASILSAFSDAIESQNFGVSRPSYITKGALWVQDVSPTLQRLMYFTGSLDVPLISINPTNGTTILPSSPSNANPKPIIPIGSIVADDNGGSIVHHLVGDIDPNTNLPNYYYGRGPDNRLGWNPLPGSSVVVQGGLALPAYVVYGPGTYSQVLPNVSRLQITVFGGGGPSYTVTPDPGDPGGSTPIVHYGGYGGCAHGIIGCTPGSTVTIAVGGVGGSTSFNGQVVCTAGGFDGANGTNSIAAGLDVGGVASPIRMTSGQHYGDPGQPGLVTMTWWE